MAILAIGGGGRGVGKTAVGCALLSGMPELRWLAVKATPHGHGLPSGIWEESDRSSEKDTGRYLTAGAGRAFLVTGGGRCAEARNRAPECDGLLVESNEEMVVGTGERALRLAVLGREFADCKDSLARFAAAADGWVLAAGLDAGAHAEERGRRSIFPLAEGEWSSPELIQFVRRRLLG